MAGLGFSRLHERVRSCQNHRNHQCYQQTPQLHHYTRKPAATINCCDSIAVPSSYTIGLSIKAMPWAWSSLRMRSAWAKLRVYEQLALESWLQFQHRSDRQTTQRFQGALQNLRPARGRQAYAIAAPALASVHFHELGIALAIYLLLTQTRLPNQQEN